MKKLNIEYLKPVTEPLWFGALLVRQALRRKPKAAGTLIINVCLVGEFAASVPAMFALMQTLDGPVDVLVSPPLKELAQALRGVRRVYTAHSSFERADENVLHEALPASYGTVYVLRMSAGAYRAMGPVRAGKIKTGLRHYSAYGLHLGWMMLRGKTPTPFREINFRMVRRPEHYVPFEQMFDVSPQERAAMRTLPELSGPEKKIVIHTGASWVRNRWPLAYWAGLLQLINQSGQYRFIFVGSPKDKSDFDAIAAQLPFPIYSLIGAITLRQLAIALGECDFLIGVDSGPRNLAHLVGLRSITLLGPAPHLYTPPDPLDAVLDKSGGRRVLERFVDRGGTSLMEQHTPEEVFDLFIKMRG